jgi:lantibiotic transport system ATP-binding protein
MYCIETVGLQHHFDKEKEILNDINLKVPLGSIYGFLGPNGAGKTTTLKLILGLLKKQKGSICFQGKELSMHRIEVLSKIGSIIESPSIYTHLTAKENLQIQCLLYNCDKHRIQDVLVLTGLSDTGKKRTGQFSLGMKQRLSIAIALLHQPELLILDEPTNGLDPNGIIEMRDLLKQINKEKGTTILISSHLLSEIEKIVTHLGIIHKGNMLFEGTLTQLNSEKNKITGVRFVTANNQVTYTFFKNLGIATTLQDNGVLIETVSDVDIASLNRRLVEDAIDVYRIEGIQESLESIFIQLISK